jgi:hypothetical protein
MESWAVLQENVKTISSFIWNCTANNETINGIKIDCVLKPTSDFWIIVEVTENQKLEKVRDDITKIAACKQYLFSQNTYCKGFIVMKDEPTESMVTTGMGSNIQVQSYVTFSKQFIDFPTYSYIRKQRAFGSSVNPFSGEPDTNGYTPVYYENIRTKKKVNLGEIAKSLVDGKRLVLLGNYGTGKSRCIRELFNNLINRPFTRIVYPVAINLKENWGTQRADEIIRRHFGALGLTQFSDPIIKILDKNNFIFLLDGFDEVGAQIWSDDPSKLKQIRASSLSAVKDLIQTTKSSIIISGREHYFNSNEEMFEAIGLKANETEILRCKDEFTLDEMSNYLKSLSITTDIPIWLPRRPLICQIINTLEKDKLKNIFVNSYSASEFWDTLIKSICDREAKISPVLDSENIYSILKEIAHLTRIKQGNVGPISISEINKTFEKVLGTPPVDESAVMLQRLPALGRISSESTDRQFIDYYILDGLRAENLIDIVYNNKVETLEENWIHPIQNIGIEILAKRIFSDKSAYVFLEFLKKTLNATNRIISGDLLASLIYYSSNTPMDLNGIIAYKTTISSINFSKSLIDNFILNDSYINDLDISTHKFSKIVIKDCIIKKIHGIASPSELPPFIVDSMVAEFELSPMEIGDRFLEIKPSQMILLSIIKKAFFLNHIETTETEMVDTFASEQDKSCARKILKILLRDKVLSKSLRGKLQPKSYHRKRMINLIQKLNNSDDKLWNEVGTHC